MEINDVRARLQAKLRPELEEFDSQKRLLSHTGLVTGRINELISPMYEELQIIHPGVDFRWRDKQCETLLFSRSSIAQTRTFIFRWYTAARATFGPVTILLNLRWDAG